MSETLPQNKTSQVYTFDPSMWEAEAGGVWSVPGLGSKFQTSQGDVVMCPCPKSKRLSKIWAITKPA